MLSPFQKKMVSCAITCAAIMFIAFFAVSAFVLAAKFLAKFSSVIWPIAAAGIVSFILKPAVDALSRRTKVSAGMATLIIFALLAVAVSAVAIWILPALADQISGIVKTLPEIVQNALRYIGEHFPELKNRIVEQLGKPENLPKISMAAAAGGISKTFKTLLGATGSVAATCSFLAAFAAAPIYLYYMLSTKFDSYAMMNKNMSFLPDGLREDIVFLARRFVSIMSSFFRGQLTIAFIMGILLGAGFGIAGVKYGFLLGFCAGMLNIIPYFGTVIGLGTTLPTAFFQDGGGLGLVAAAVAIFVAVQLLESYYLTPRIMGSNTGLHPAVIIFSVFFWAVALEGILGMILAIPLSAFLEVLWKLLLSKYLKKDFLYKNTPEQADLPDADIKQPDL